jgi:hypothetical protein
MEDHLVFVESQHSALGEASDGTYPVVIMTPGQGTTAYYSEAVIKRDAPKAFPKGTHVYLSHQRGTNGEPDPGRLLGFLVEDTTIRDTDGAALNRFKPIRKHAEFVEDVHKGVGLSIAAAGTATMGMIEGKQVRIAQSIDKHIANTVDMVSWPGLAGSGFVESAFAQFLAENVHPDPEDGPPQNGNKMAELTEETLKGFTESMTALVTLVESRLPAAPAVETPEVKNAAEDRKAAVEATRIVESAEISKDLKDKLIESISNGDYEVQAKIDEHKTLRESIKTELETQFRESGHVIGAAGATGAAGTPTVTGWSTN